MHTMGLGFATQVCGYCRSSDMPTAPYDREGSANGFTDIALCRMSVFPQGLQCQLVEYLGPAHVKQLM